MGLKRIVRLRSRAGMDRLRAELGLFRHPRGVISFPKSGRTWLRVMLDDLGVSAVFSHAQYKQIEHCDSDTEREARLYKRFIVLVRDPRDVTVSSYHSAVKREFRTVGTLSEYVRCDVIEKIVAYNLHWADYVAKTPDAALTSYERLHRDGARALADIVSFLGQERAMEDVSRVFAHNSVDKMRAREAAGAYADRYGKILMPRDADDPDSYKVRRGNPGNYVDEMSSGDIAFCNELLGRHDYFNRIEALLPKSTQPAHAPSHRETPPEAADAVA